MEPIPVSAPTPSRAWRYKDTVYLVIGGLLLIGGILGVLVSTLYMEPFYFIWGTALCSATGVIPGAILVVLGWRAHQDEKLLVDFSAWVRTYRRIPMNDLAQNLRKSRLETEGILARAVDRGLVQGIVDRTTDEFVVRESIGQQIFVEKCPHCGATIHRWFLPEDRFICAYCGQPILASAAASSHPAPPGDTTLK